MFLQRQEFDVGETILLGVVSEQRRDLAVGQRPILFFGDSSPRAEMNFVDRERFAPGLAFGSFGFPCAIMKFES